MPTLQDALIDSPYPPKITEELFKLHEGDRRSVEARRARGGFLPGENTDDIVRLGSEYLALSPDEGQFLYMLARSSGAKRVVEFGASFGVSTLYFAAAMRETGGHLITTEVHPDKCAALRETFERAGVSDCVTLLEGDARETLQNVEGPIDMVLLDGWKGMYLDVLTILKPKVRAGGLIAADNVNFMPARPYVDHVMDPSQGFLTHFVDDLALSMKLGPANAG